MAFSMDGVIIDRIQVGWAETMTDNKPLFALHQLSDAKIDVTSESKEAKDANGTLVKKFYTGKSGTFTANNAMIDFNILAASTGSEKVVVDGSKVKSVEMPRIVHVSKSTASLAIPDAVEGSVRVVGLAGNDSVIQEYAKHASAASATEFAITGTNENMTLQLPTDGSTPGLVRYLVKYNRVVKKGAVAIRNEVDKFPRTIRLTLKALAVDPCSPDEVRACYIVLPSFQVSPDVSFTLSTDATLEFKGDLQADYCSENKTLYEIYFAEDEKE